MENKKKINKREKMIERSKTAKRKKIREYICKK